MEQARINIRNAREGLVGAGSHGGTGARAGFEGGLNTSRPRIDPIVKKWLNIITSAITDIFQIFSPARTMVPYGQKVSEGLLQGIISNRQKMRGVIKAMGIDIGKWMAALFPGGRGGGSAKGLVGFAARYFAGWKAMFPWMTIGGWRARGSVPGSDHPKGKALDLMTTNALVAARIIGTFLQQPGAKYWIWNRQIADARSGWRIRPYSGPSPHTDHVHLSYFRRGGILPENVIGFGGSGRGYYLHAQERVVPVGGDGGSVNDFRTFVNVRVTARGSITDQRGLMRAIEDVTRTEIAESHKRLARELASR
jgi:hypothetical protein